MSKEIYPPMHTAEHILNQTMVRLYNCGRAFGAHIEKKKSKLDYRFDRALTPEEVKKIEDQVNKIINDDLPIYEEFMHLTEAETKFDLKRVPDGVLGDKVRIIKIGDYDAVPCIDPHVKTTKEIGQFRIISSDWTDGVLRIRYKLS